MPPALSLTVAIICGLLCLVAGVFFGSHAHSEQQKMTDAQRKASSLLCFIIAIVFVVLMFTGQDLATWTILGGIVVGFAVGKIPPLHEALVAKWDFFEAIRAEEQAS
ncbi:hypothetical protein BCAT_0697 [Bifidobacterium catenulatum DSM 16992 = JCM 1194 = LMG 11043]|nr:hypothetical protein [Bifidobacterium catenulatum]KFI55146.1 hypothetical protein BCAT_0697 [Bifidobacterium catenulatum DSM 16992 = JCM 1194 = LMG 11043]